jgi:hypothetical protein
MEGIVGIVGIIGVLTLEEFSTDYVRTARGSARE